MQPRTNAGRRTRNTVVLALIVAGLWAGVALTRGASHPDEFVLPVRHVNRA